MEQRPESSHQDFDRPNVDIGSISVLLGVVFAALIAIGVVTYLFGEDQSSTMSVANDPPLQSQQPMRDLPARDVPAAPGTVGQSERQ
jgi:hypothetical protein